MPQLVIAFSQVELLSPVSTMLSSPLGFGSYKVTPVATPKGVMFPLPVHRPCEVLTLTVVLLLSPVAAFLSVCAGKTVSAFSPVFTSK